MFWLFFWGYIAVGAFIAGPVLTKRLYAVQYEKYYMNGKPNLEWGYGSKNRSLGRAGKIMTDHEIQQYIWHIDRGIIPLAMVGALVWPISLYAVALRYSATYSQVKEKQRIAEQKQQELDLERARELIRSYRDEDHADYDKKLLGMDKTVGKLEKGKRR